jgi:hypothetical protein
VTKRPPEDGDLQRRNKCRGILVNVNEERCISSYILFIWLKLVTDWHNALSRCNAILFRSSRHYGPAFYTTYHTVIFVGHFEIQIALDKHGMGKRYRKPARLTLTL